MRAFHLKSLSVQRQVGDVAARWELGSEAVTSPYSDRQRFAHSSLDLKLYFQFVTIFYQQKIADDLLVEIFTHESMTTQR